MALFLHICVPPPRQKQRVPLTVVLAQDGNQTAVASDVGKSSIQAHGVCFSFLKVREKSVVNCMAVFHPTNPQSL